MTRRARQLVLCLAALAAGVGAALVVSGAAPVGAAEPTASFTATDYAWEVTGSPGVNEATIAVGGTVTFGYPDGSNFHNVAFTSSQPTSCAQTAGPVGGPVPPLPAFPTSEGWSGTCTFNTAGDFAFVCEAHGFMTGTVHVGEPTGTTGPTTGTTTTPSDDPKPGNQTGEGPAGGTPDPRPKVSVARRQRGAVLRGTVTTPAGRSRIAVTAFASNRALTGRRPKRARQVKVGSQSKRSTGTGTTSFAVRLGAAARRALGRRHRLAVTLRVVVTPDGGHAVSKTVAVTVRRR